MARNLRKFNTYNDYETAELVRPAVSLVLSPRKVYFDPINPTPPTPTFDGKWKATYSDSSVRSAECDVSSEITNKEIDKSNLVSVEIGDCVTSIGNGAFNGYSSLTNIVIPDSVTNIGTTAFDRCSSLTSIDIPSGVTSIGNRCFYNCNSLTSITCLATTPPSIEGESQAFYGTNNCPIYVPSGSVNAYKAASGWSDYASRIQAIPNS